MCRCREYRYSTKLGVSAGYRGVGRHITERKRAEAEHRAHVWFLESMDRVNRAMQREAYDSERMMNEVLAEALGGVRLRPGLDHLSMRPECSFLARRHGAHAAGVPGRLRHWRDLPMTAPTRPKWPARRSIAAAPCRPGPSITSARVKPGSPSTLARSEMLMALHPKGDQPYLFGLHQCSRPRLWTNEEQRLFEEIGHRLTGLGGEPHRSPQPARKRAQAGSGAAHRARRVVGI